jgi:RHS repeat-associated protein
LRDLLTPVVGCASGLRRVVGVVTGILLVLVASTGLAAAGGSGGDPSGVPSRPQLDGKATGVGPPANDPVLLAQARAEMEALERRRVRRSTPAARELRDRLRAAFAGQGRLEALETAREQFPRLLEHPVWSPPAQQESGRVERYIGAHQAVVEIGGGERRLLNSVLPLRARTSGGELEPVEVALEERATVYEPRNPLAEVAISKDVSEGIRFGDLGLTVRALGSGVSESSEPALADGKLFWANVDVDTDLMVAPLPLGVETFTMLRSAASPEQHEFALDLPRGAVLAADPDREGGAVVRQDGRAILGISPAFAVDADGESVPVDMAVRDDRLVLRVEHRDRDVAYPIAVDPVIDDYAWWGEEEMAQWEANDNPPNTFDFFVGSGLFIYSDPTVYYPHTAYGQWTWTAPGDAFIATAEFHDARNFFYSGGSCISEAVFSVTRWDWEPGSWHVPGTPYSGATPWTTCAYDGGGHVKVHNLSAPTPGNVFVFRHWMYGDGYRASDASLGAVRLLLGDFSAPTVTGAAANPRWIHPTPQEPNVEIEVDARDAGLGLNSFTLEGAGPAQTKTIGCAGTAYNPCPIDTEELAIPPGFTVDTRSWSEGLHRPRAIAADVLGQASAAREVPVGVDRQPPPAPQLSGELHNRRGQTLPHGQYQLNISAQDGNPAGPDSARQAGVTKLEVYLGKPGSPESFDRVYEKKQDCASDSCALSASWTLKTLEEAGGPTSVKVFATDGVGHRTAAAAFDVTLPESGDLITPKDQARTSKRLGLQAKANATNLSAVKFQYRRSTGGVWGDWADVPASALTRRGEQVAAAQQPLGEDRKSPLLIWDVPATLAPVFVGPEFEPVRIQVRAVFSGGQGGSSRAHDVTLDQDTPAVSATQGIGPGQVDLLSGNFSYSATDVQIASFGQALTVTRTYNSRVRSSAPAGPFGVRSWTLGVDIAGASTYIGLREATDGSGNVEVVQSAGTPIWFEARATGFIPQPGYEDLTLHPKQPAEAGSGCAGDVYKLADIDGNATTFERQGGEWVICKVRQPGQSEQANTSRYLYENGPDGKPRIKKVAAPAPAGASCLTSATAACRVLEFEYGASGHAHGRLIAVKFHHLGAPAGGETVMRYEYTADGKLSATFDPRISPALRETYTYTASDGHRLETITPPGEASWKLSYQALPSGDPSPGRLASVERPAGGAKTTVFYRLPVTGPSARYEMGAGAVAAWGQNEPPTDATAIVPATELSPTPNSPKATVYYLDHAGRQVNTVLPSPSNTQTSFEATTTEYDEHDNPIRDLSPANRRKALAMGGDVATTAARARLYDTQRTYSADGLELLTERGPQHEVKLESGALVQARSHTQTSYGCNDQQPKAHLPARTESGAQLSDGSIVDVRVSTTEYDCTLRQPTKTVTDPGGLNLTRTTRYDPANGLSTETRMPSNPDPNSAGDAGTTRTLYYSDGPHSEDPDCGGHPEWWNLPCKTKPATQPGTPGLPDLPVTTYTYNRLHQVVTKTERVGSDQRVTTITYDDAGRKRTEGISATVGDPVPTVTTDYHSATGRPTSVSTTEGGVTRTLTTAYDSLGRPTEYIDADGNRSTTSYDLLSRPITTTDGKGTQTRTYDATSGLLTQLDDSHAGRFTASYDPDGKLASKTYPNGLRANTIYDETGAPTDLTYTKTGCTTNCVWFEDHVEESVHGQWLSRQGSLSNQSYGYDRAGRLTNVRDSVTATSCTTTRTYGFDRNSNRTEFTSRTSGEGNCDTAAAGLVAKDERSANPGSYQGGVTLGKAGAVGDADTAAGFDGSNDEVTAGGPTLTSAGATLQGWFNWESGNSLMRDHTHLANSGWILAFDNNGTLAYRVGGKTYNTTRTTASVRGGWHQFTLTVSQGNTTLYLDGAAIHSGTGAGSQQTTMPWHIMHNGNGPVFAKGKADDIAVYNRGLSASEVREHFDAGGTAPSTYRNQVVATSGLLSYWRLGDSTTQARNSSYDRADRLTGEGVAYDSFGRMTSIPAAHAGGGTLTSRYYTNDMVRSQTQDGVTSGWLLDPTQTRHRASVPNAGNQEILHYQDGSDAPAWSEQLTNGATVEWTRYIDGIDSDLTAVYESKTGKATLELTNLHGDVVAIASTDPAASGPLETFEADEYGNPRQPSVRRYGWLGGKQRRAELRSGVTQMGVRSYIPAMGRFTSVDPVVGGSANPYEYNHGDPINRLDLDGAQSRRRGSCSLDFDESPWQWSLSPEGVGVTGDAAIRCNFTSYRPKHIRIVVQLIAVVNKKTRIGSTPARVCNRTLSCEHGVSHYFKFPCGTGSFSVRVRAWGEYVTRRGRRWRSVPVAVGPPSSGGYINRC